MPSTTTNSRLSRRLSSSLARALSARLNTAPAGHRSTGSILPGVLLAAATGLTPSIVLAQNSDARPRYDIFWDVREDAYELAHRSKVDWAAQISFDGVAINPNFWTIYEDVLADDVRTQGLHITRRADWRETMAKRLQRNIDSKIPADAEGYGALDIEFLAFIWGNRTGGPGLRPSASPEVRKHWDRWYDYIRTERPELLAGKSTAQAEDILDKTYVDAVRDFVTTCLQEAKRLRPKVRWGLYGYPNWRNAEYGYPDPNPAKQANDKLSWLWDACDVAYPSLYQNRIVVPDGTPITDSYHQTSQSFNRNFMATNIREARRVIGPDKAVIAYVMLRHPEYTGPIANQWLNDANLHDSIHYPKEVGADGVVVWGVVGDEASKNDLQNYLDAKFLPKAAAVASPLRSANSGSATTGAGEGPNKRPPQARVDESGNLRAPRTFAGRNQHMVTPAPARSARTDAARPARPGVTRIVTVPEDTGQ